MITRAEFELYKTDAFIGAVEENLLRNPNDIALDKHIPFARELASRVKYLQKAKTKLPSFYAARCIIPPRAYEQSTGEAVAAEKMYAGDSCLDLTCGLGVDSYSLSKNFTKVTALERDPLLAEITRYNFSLLGADNIEVVNSCAEEYLTANPQGRFDLIYADPDRRDSAGKRVAALEDCSPDVRAMLPHLKRVADKVVIKLSPLFDVHEAFRIFGTDTKVTVISDGGECKEVLVETGTDTPEVIAARVTGQGEISFPYRETLESYNEPLQELAGAGYLAVPDVALSKSGIAAVYYKSEGWFMASRLGFAYGNMPLPAFGSRTYPIIRVEPYNPKQLKKLLKEEGITRLNFFVREFPYGTAQVARQLGISEGGTRFAALTTVCGRQVFILLGEW